MTSQALAFARRVLNGFAQQPAAKGKPTRRAKRERGLEIEPLERREMNAVSSVSLSSAVLVIVSNSTATNVEVKQSGTNVVVQEIGSNRSWSYAAAQVGSVEFQGGAGNDRFVNNVNTLAARGFGSGGNDFFQGSGGGDYFEGGAGNDKLIGLTGNDRLFGGDGLDVLLGGAGEDELSGGTGDDRLNGGIGLDKLLGGDGNDVLIAIDGAKKDWMQGDGGSDILWADQAAKPDTLVGGTLDDKVHWVVKFDNSADLTLDGDRIADPTTRSGHTYKTFADKPLFSSLGPRYDDIRQGALGDCYFLAGLSAIAKDSPQAVRSQVVDFDDGTYGVRLGSSFFRVDNDLPVGNVNSTTPAYAKLGAENSMWVAVVEKAFAHFRYGANSYGSIEGGWGIEANLAFNTKTPGDRSIQSYANGKEAATEIYNRWLAGAAVTVGFIREKVAGVGGAPLVMSHMYTVIGVTLTSGKVSSITLRNPWGIDGAGNDANPNDGLVTITPDQLYRYVGGICWGKV